jgi:hypothetical protein
MQRNYGPMKLTNLKPKTTGILLVD